MGAIGAAVVAVTVGVPFSQQLQSAQATEDESPNKAKAVTIKRDIVFSFGSCEPSDKRKLAKYKQKTEVQIAAGNSRTRRDQELLVSAEKPKNPGENFRRK